MAEVMKDMLKDSELEKISGGAEKPSGIFRAEDSSKLYENVYGNRYKMLPDGSWVFERKLK